MRRRLPWAAIAGATVLLRLAAAEPPEDVPPRRSTGSSVRWWEDPELVRALRLTPAQAAAIDGAYGRSRQKREAVGRLQRAGRQRLAEALGQPALDTRALDRVVADLARLQRKRLRSIVALRLAARRILTPPQLTRLLELRPALMSQRWDRPRRTRPSRARVSTPTQ